MQKTAILVWYRNDLRIHDNEAFYEASQKSSFIIPVYCFDPTFFAIGNAQSGMDIKRAAFVLESVAALKKSLQEHGSDLLTFVGNPEDIIPHIAQKYQVDEVYHYREVASYETKMSEKVETALWKIQINLKHFIGHTLYLKEDLPFPIKDIPDSFSVFRKKIERESIVRKTIPLPEHYQLPSYLEKTELPTLADLGYVQSETNEALFTGGETAGLEMLERVLAHYPEYDYDYLRPYIAIGSLSPVTVYQAVEQSPMGAKHFRALIERLIWRDYFRFMLKKYPNIFFNPTAVNQLIPETDPRTQEELFQKWSSGQTDNVFVNQAINQLLKYGFIPYMARVIIASYLIYELHVDWLKGASWFEKQVLDFSPSTTYGYWAHIAGVGTSEKENKPIDWEVLIKKHYPNGLPAPLLKTPLIG